MSIFIYWRMLWRAKLIWVLVAFLGVTLGCTFLAAMFSGRQPATVGLDVAISVIKLLFPLALVLMMQELFSREFERRYFLISLSYPYSRNYFLFSRFIFIFVLLTIFLFLTAGTLWLLLQAISKSYPGDTPIAFGINYWLVFGFITIDFLVLSSVALFLAVVASTPSFVLLGTFGFMLIARSFATIITLLKDDNSLAVLVDAETYNSSLGVLSYILPDLGALDVRSIALYDYIDFLPESWHVLLLMMVIYTGIFLALSSYALNFKRFS